MSEFLYRFREPLSATVATVLMLLSLLMLDAAAPALKRTAARIPPIELTFVAPEIQPAPEPQRVQPSTAASPAARRHSAQTAVPAMAPMDTGKTASAPAAPLAPETTAPEAPPASVPPPVPTNAGQEARAEAIYVARLRAYLQSIKRYPTGREVSLQRPAGSAMIWFTLRRSGVMVEAGIETSSSSMLLDNAALATIRRGSYPAFPDEAWAGKAQQRFSVELDFVPSN